MGNEGHKMSSKREGDSQGKPKLIKRLKRRESMKGGEGQVERWRERG